MAKINEKEKAVSLRKKGLSYSEILKEVSVAKSTLSLWLKDVGLNKGQKQRITQKRLDAAIRGGIAKRNQRLTNTREIIEKASQEIGKISKRELWLIGVILYWAEGAKQKPHLISQRVAFTNSDPMVIRIFLKWLYEIVGVTVNDVTVAIYIHETGDEIKAKKYWSEITNIPVYKFQKTVFKKHNIRTNRKYNNDSYYGLIKLTVSKSTNFNRRITGWINGICKVT